MKLRPATESDLGAAARLWNVHLGASLPLREAVLRLTIFDDPTLREGDALCAVDGTDVVGFGWAKRWRAPWSDLRFERVGFVGGLVAGAPGRGIGSALLNALEARLAEEGCERIEISGGLLHLLPGVPREASGALRFFERHGYTFEPEPHFDLAGDLRAFEAGPTPSARVATEADRPALLDFLAREFPGSWQLHARWHFEHGGLPSDFVVVDTGPQIDGFCHIFRPDAWPAGPSTYWSSAGGLGPIGVSAALRGQGLGQQLMDASLAELRQSGVQWCTIDWTRLVDFYARFGFRPKQAYLRGHKRLVE
jgi:GNAT superfamily N-acetyltransferase